jgi:hypothetical protein
VKLQQESLSRRGNKQASPAWHVIYVNDTELQPQVRKFASLENMRDFLIEQRRTSPDTFAVPVFGVLGHYSRAQGPTDRRYLIHPNGKVIPLFEAIEELEVDNSFLLGDADLDLSPVPTEELSSAPRRPTRQRQTSQLLEEDDIDEEDPEMDDAPSL